MKSDDNVSISVLRNELQNSTRKICICIACCAWFIALTIVETATTHHAILKAIVFGFPFLALGFYGFFRFVRSMKQAVEADRAAR